MPRSAKPSFPTEVRSTIPRGKVAAVCDKTIGPPLRDLRERYNLSTRELACVLSVPWETVKSMLHERAGVRIVARYTPEMIKGVTEFLRSRDLPDSEVMAELKKLFPKENFEQMTTPRVELDEDDLTYWNLDYDPFIGHPENAKAVFETRDLNQILKKLEDAVRGQQFRAVVGDIGSGKTVLKGRLMDLAKKSQGRIKLFWPKFVEMERVTSGSIVYFLLEALNQKPRARMVMAQAQLEKVLKQHYDAGDRIALCFDEGHHLSKTVFSALKNFYELGEGFDNYLGIILFGQPKLEGNLKDIEFREIAERLRVLKMPSISDVAVEYVDHRLRPAGRKVTDLFETAAIKILAGQAKTPLGIGNLCSKALVGGHNAGETKITAAFVKAHFGPQVRSQRPSA